RFEAQRSKRQQGAWDQQEQHDQGYRERAVSARWKLSIPDQAHPDEVVGAAHDRGHHQEEHEKREQSRHCALGYAALAGPCQGCRRQLNVSSSLLRAAPFRARSDGERTVPQARSNPAETPLLARMRGDRAGRNSVRAPCVVLCMLGVDFLETNRYEPASGWKAVFATETKEPL